MYAKPKRLRPGSRVALVAPAGPVDDDRIDAARALCARFELTPALGRSAGARAGYLAGPDAARRADLEWAFSDPTIDAVWALRGGYGTMRILRMLDLRPVRERPRAFIGFSDNTALHLVLDRVGVVSFHGPHAGAAFPDITERSFRRVLCEAEAAGALPADVEAPAQTLVGGSAHGTLIGGNLAMLAALAGTPYALRARGRILVIEDVGEPLYRIDRMLTQLDLAGCLEGVTGIAFGRFSGCGAPDPSALQALLSERVARLGVPVVAGLPFGHVDENWCIPFGVRARLDADGGRLEILESAVT